MTKHDFREFVFTATGRDTDINDVDTLTLFDNLVAELERLQALAELLIAVRADEFEPRFLTGVGQLLGDVRARMRAVLDLAINKNPKKKKKKR